MFYLNLLDNDNNHSSYLNYEEQATKMLHTFARGSTCSRRYRTGTKQLRIFLLLLPSVLCLQ